MEAKGLRYEQWEIGRRYETAARTVTEADIVSFAGLSGDFNPLHTDETYAAKTMHGGRIAHGALTFAITTGLINQSGITDGTAIGFMSVGIRWTAPVKPGDTIRAAAIPQEKRLTKKGDRGIVNFLVEVRTQNDVIVSEQEWTVMVVV